ncbi:MAG TPA: glycosyltransferase family 4 protein [Fimbriimonadaceae bacterium]|nr:glycosyltransferase family 4 protein [Fimbriimonadaceae bacterium]
MRIVVHDYSGHPFQVQLSRRLAGRGHDVLHLYCEEFLTPHGALEKRPGDPATFAVESIVLGRKVDKSNVFKRRSADIEHGKRAVQRIAAFKPDVVLSANSPLDAQKLILQHCKKSGAKFVFWVQDLFGQAIKRLMAGRYAGIGNAAGAYYMSLESKMLIDSDAIIVIVDTFIPFLPPEIRESRKVHVIENWAPLDELPLEPRSNDWGHRLGLDEGLNFLYSGTLGMKHNPELLVRLAESVKNKGRLIVVSEGPTIPFLEGRIRDLSLDNLRILPFQPFEEMPKMLATADVLVAILEPDAGVFAVPSKVLTYLCAGKPLLLAIPKENLAAQIVTRAEAGLVSDPTDERHFISNAEILQNDLGARERLGKNARTYAERAFDIESVTDRFEVLLQSLSDSHPGETGR